MASQGNRTDKRLPLEGVRVLAFTQAWAGPYAGTLLADWGAEVIVVENLWHFSTGTRGLSTQVEKLIPESQRIWSRGYPDWEPGEKPWNRYGGFNSLNRNKLAVTLDESREEGRELFLRLTSLCDVVLENSPPSALNDICLDYADLRKVKPDLIMARMPGYGLTGPYKDFKAWGSHIEGFIGHTWIRSYRDVDPSLKDDVYPSDAVAGITTAFSILVALRHLQATGEGQLIDSPLAEGLIPFLAEAFMDYGMNGRVHSATGNADTSMAPHNVYRCSGDDEWVSISVESDEEWEGLVGAMGGPEWALDRKYSHVLGRWRRQEEINGHIGEWTRGLSSREVMERLQGAGVPAGMVHDAAQAYADPQLEALDFFQEVTHPAAGTHRYPGVMGRISGFSNRIQRPAPCLGGNNEYVYRELMGMSAERYRELEEQKQIGTDFVVGGG